MRFEIKKRRPTIPASLLKNVEGLRLTSRHSAIQAFPEAALEQASYTL